MAAFILLYTQMFWTPEIPTAVDYTLFVLLLLRRGRTFACTAAKNGSNEAFFPMSVDCSRFRS